VRWLRAGTCKLFVGGYMIHQTFPKAVKLPD
jgi:hypothetical protein